MLEPTFEAERKALRRLINAFLDPDPGNIDRVSRIEEALISAKMALGEDDFNEEVFLGTLEMVAVQTLSLMLDDEQKVYRVQASQLDEGGSEEAVLDILVTSDEIVSSCINSTLISYSKMQDPENHS